MTSKSKSKVPDGLWSSCPSCESILYAPDLEKSLFVCPKCDHHLRIGARKRLEIFLDNGYFEEIAADIKTKDSLKFKDTKNYSSRIKDAVSNTGENEAIIIGKGALDSMDVVVAAFEFRFMGGSMGGVVGEKFVQGVNEAIKSRCPFVCFSTSGGARMQEGIVSLMQMPRTIAAVDLLNKNNIPYIVILTEPTTGGVTASFAMLGDITIAEQGATIGFAGKRVIQDTIREELPIDFQKAEYLKDHGMVDIVSHRKNLKETLYKVLDHIS